MGHRLFLCVTALFLAGCAVSDPEQARPDLRILVMPDGQGGAQAIAPDCGEWKQPATTDNMPYPNHGCASARNLAQMLARPEDLVAPRPLGPADAARNASALERLHSDKVRGLYDPTFPPSAKE